VLLLGAVTIVGCSAMQTGGGGPTGDANANLGPNSNAGSQADQPADNSNGDSAALDNSNAAEPDPMDDTPPDDEPPGSDGGSAPPPDPGDGDMACDPACPAGLSCVQGECVADSQPQAELGYTDQTSGAYQPVGDGAAMPLFTLGQGGGHLFLTFRLTGFPPPESGPVTIGYEFHFQSDGMLLNEFSQMVAAEDIGDGVQEIPRRFVFLNAFPEVLDGQIVTADITLTAPGAQEPLAVISQTLLLDFQN
jgi:hypothetical protein